MVEIERKIEFVVVVLKVRVVGASSSSNSAFPSRHTRPFTKELSWGQLTPEIISSYTEVSCTGWKKFGHHM